MVRFSKGWDYSYGHLKFDLINVQISNVSEFQKVGFQIPIVV